MQHYERAYVESKYQEDWTHLTREHLKLISTMISTMINENIYH